MSWRLAKSLIKLREQVNAAYPNRDKASDGTIGDAAHSSRKSDHNPNSAGVVTAIDIDADLAPGVNVRELVDALFASKDPRIKYIIFNGRITVAGLAGWKRYTGANAHKAHAHISVSSRPSLYDDAGEWQINPAVTAPLPRPTLRRGDRGETVKELQQLLKLPADGIFGEKTEAGVKGVQLINGLRPDGIVGRQTWGVLTGKH